MTTVICGSLAYDTIMVFSDHFKDHILPDKIHILNVSFLVPEMRREFGGCAGNISYNLNMLGGDCVPMATVGEDFDPYATWMDKNNIRRTHVKTIEGSYTAQAFITTDLDDNQITAFHPGAMNRAHDNHIGDVGGASLGIVAPDGRDAMIQHAAEFAGAGIPFIFDPGQGLPMFDGNDLETFIDQASYVVVNDYESQMIQEKTGKGVTELASKVDAFIETLGPHGSRIHTQGNIIEVPAAKISEPKDPTGCGDAYRAGLLYGLANNLDWQVTGRLASLIGGIKIEQAGTQNHSFDRDYIEARFKDSFGMSLN